MLNVNKYIECVKNINTQEQKNNNNNNKNTYSII